ncbi:MAG TPA: hypothetical protein VMG38_04215 [Trebonia sp.]|nr:hypothetical protein [Trebonia sp.]
MYWALSRSLDRTREQAAIAASDEELKEASAFMSSERRDAATRRHPGHAGEAQ